MRRLNAIIGKEFLHILRDPRSLTIVFILPVFMILIYGHSISFDLSRIDAVIIDLSSSRLSKTLSDDFSHNRYYAIRQPDQSTNGEAALTQAEKLLRAGTIKEIIVIPADFARKIEANRQAEVGVIIDGSDANVANLVYQYNEQIITNFIMKRQGLDRLFTVATKIFFNPEAKSQFFFIPGLIAVLMLMVSAMLTSLSISKEKEIGSISLLFISPLRSRDIILGKTIPYVAVALIEEVIILLFARFWFQIPIRGSLLVLFVFSLLYVLSGLSFGILVSTSAPSQRVAIIATLLLTMLPSFLLSGFIFPLDSLGVVLRWISHLIPATYFLKIIRGVILKDAELKHFLFEGAMLILFSALLIAAAVRKFSRLREKSQ